MYCIRITGFHREKYKFIRILVNKYYLNECERKIFDLGVTSVREAINLYNQK